MHERTRKKEQFWCATTKQRQNSVQEIILKSAHRLSSSILRIFFFPESFIYVFCMKEKYLLFNVIYCNRGGLMKRLMRNNGLKFCWKIYIRRQKMYFMIAFLDVFFLSNCVVPSSKRLVLLKAMEGNGGISCEIFSFPFLFFDFLTSDEYLCNMQF